MEIISAANEGVLKILARFKQKKTASRQIAYGIEKATEEGHLKPLAA